MHTTLSREYPRGLGGEGGGGRIPVTYLPFLFLSSYSTDEMEKKRQRQRQRQKQGAKTGTGTGKGKGKGTYALWLGDRYLL